MKLTINYLLSLCRLAVFSTVLFSSVIMSAHAKNFLMWQLPDSVIPYPVYVYQNGKQIDYLYGPTQQAIISEYSLKTAASYELYYSKKIKTSQKSLSGIAFVTKWYKCEVVLKTGAVQNPETTCPGTVINPPAAKASNVYTVAMGANVWAESDSPDAPIPTDFGKRQITFKNNTKHSMIRIGQVCTKSANPHNLKNCQNTRKLFEIKKGDSKKFIVDNAKEEGKNFPAGLSSYAFMVTAYKDTASSSVIETGGYGVGELPYATKIEFTSKPVTTSDGMQVPTGATNFDISAVDGYNISAKGYPSAPTYCTYTVPPENSNLLGAGHYSKKVPLAYINAGQTLCKASSQLPSDVSGKNKSDQWDLQLTTAKGKHYQGCMSPCTYAKKSAASNKKHKASSKDVNMFCCLDSYGTPSTCDQPAGAKGANNSSYVKNLIHPYSKHVYRFAYDDAIGDFACPAETDFTIEFTSS